MATKTSPQPEGSVPTYPKRLPFYDNEEGMRLLQTMALRRGVKASALLRMLVREEAARVGLAGAAGSAVTPPGPRRAPAVASIPIWDQLADTMQELPEEILDTLPEDLAEQHDHYLYGTAKR
jgi:hypothetical protein